MSEHKQRAIKAKATLEAKAKQYESQKIKINDEWSVVRIDDLNWQIKQKGRKEPWDRWYYGSVKSALYAVFEKSLNEQPRKWLRGDLVAHATRIMDCIAQLEENPVAEPTGAYRPH